MAAVVQRAAQNSYPVTMDGGTQDVWHDSRDISAFMDAVERQDTTFLNSLKKGKAGRNRREGTGFHSVTPRGSLVSGSVLEAATEIPVQTGHGARFQQGHVLLITNAAGAQEILWVNADPGPSSLPVKRAQGGTTALAFAANDKITIVGIAIPQLADYPMGPISRGSSSWNVYQKFATHLTYSAEADKASTVEYPNGSNLDRDMLQKGKDLKADLNQALINSRRQEGSPDPSDPIPAMMGGLRYWAEKSGNIFNLGGGSAKLTFDAVNEAIMSLDDRIGDKKGTKMLMGPRTKQIFNRLAHPYKFQAGGTGTSVDLRTDSVVTDAGTYEFEYDRFIPEGEIHIYNPKELEYAPFEALDWKGKDVPTKGDYMWRGLSGTFTLRPGNYPAMALVKGFSVNLADYPQWGKA